MGLEAEIWAMRLGGGGGAEEEEKKKKEKIPHMCESIGYRPLRGRCPKKRNELPKEGKKQIDKEINETKKKKRKRKSIKTKEKKQRRTSRILLRKGSSQN